MKAWVERIVFLNSIMALFYVIADYFTWTRMSYDLEPLGWFTGTYSNLHVNTGYWLIFREISIGGNKTFETTFQSFAQVSNMLNLPLLIFVVTIILNMILITRVLHEVRQ
jgi:hypothetical protein